MRQKLPKAAECLILCTTASNLFDFVEFDSCVIRDDDAMMAMADMQIDGMPGSLVVHGIVVLE